MPGRRDWTRETLAAGVRTGDRRALARAITLVENGDPLAYDIVADLYPDTGKAYAVGLTGPPGVGKSTLVSALIRLVRERETTVGVVSVDPSSPFTQGALLGDRIRLTDHFLDPGVFIRSMGTRGHLGGLAEATLQALLLLDAAGKDLVFLETVGTGQSEVEVTRIADTVLLVLMPGSGDSVQALKAGIMEIADVFAINKSDQPGAGRVEQELHAMLSLTEGRHPAIVKTVATEGKGIAELLELVSTRDLVSRPWSQPERAASVSIDHLGIAVKSLEQAAAFYESIGLAVGHRETVATEKVHVAMLPAGESRIELLEPSDADSPIAKFLEKRGPGLHHMALRVPDLHAAVERLRASGARLLNEPRRGAGGHLYVFVHPASAGGVLLELIQESAS